VVARIFDGLDKAWTVRQVADRLGVSTDAVRQWVRPGLPKFGRLIRLESVHVGKTVKVRPEALEAFLDACQPPLPAAGPRATPARKQRAAGREAGEARAAVDAL
jgi:excisionase family DNA binding protein